MLDIAFAKSALPKSGALVLLVEEGGERDAIFTAADQATGGAITRALEAAEFTGKKAQTCTILAPGAGLTRVVVAGLGKRADQAPRIAEEAGGAIAAALAREVSAAVAVGDVPPEIAAGIALGAVLRAYRFDRYRTKEKPEDKPRLAKLTLMAGETGRVRDAWAPIRPVAEGVHLARDLVSEPANVLNPAELAERCRKLETLGLRVEVFGPKEMAKFGFGALLGVSQGSAAEPRMVVMHWQGASASGKGRRARTSKPLAFVGKGVTFDTGGISIKPAQGMEDMKFDMAGAATVIGLMAALAGRRARVDVVGLVGLVENMPSGTAQRPGDVIRTASGQTVEVINTDAEGRLVLADVLWYCQDRLDPAFMVDLATLTGAMVMALGHEYAGFFSNDEELAQRLAAAGEVTGEKIWRMPLNDAYDKLIKSDIADMKNVGGRPAGAVSAAQFLQRFVNGRPWAHIDIAGTAWTTKDNAVETKGATGFGVRLLDRFVAEHFET